MINQIVNYIKKPYKILLKLDRHRIIKLSDARYLRYLYAGAFNKQLDLENPKTFNEKLQWLKLYDRKDIYVKMTDKYEAKKYITGIIGEEYIIPTLGIWDSFDDINFNELPNQFVLKATHDSGTVIICTEKDKFNIKKARKKLNKALKSNFYYFNREWPYKDIKPRIICEKYIAKIGEELKDYKLMCFNGEVKCSFVCIDRNSNSELKVDFYDTNWKLMPFERKYKNSGKITNKPFNYEKMVEIAEKISKKIRFLRVDFFEVDKKLYIGELTFYPGAGLEEFYPEEYDKVLGGWINLDSF